MELERISITVLDIAPPDLERKPSTIPKEVLYMYSDCQRASPFPALKCEPLMLDEAHRLSELEEVLGDLHRVEKTDGGCLALIGRILVLLPPEMAEKLQALVGKRIGVLRLDGYRLRCMESAR